MKFERQLAWPCHDCAVRGSSFCSSLIDRSPSDSPPAQNQVSQVFLSVEKHEVVRRDGNGHLSGPFVLCEGWAYRFYRFPDGRRQILSVLIPGDLFSAVTLIDPGPDFTVQAITDIKICQLGRDGIKKELAAKPAAWDAIGKLCSIEIDETRSTLIDLNEQKKTKRIVSFAQRLIKRLLARGIAIGPDVYQFPLSHIDIADATGLTLDDVNRAIKDLRDIVDMSDSVLTVLDPTKFENYAMAPVRK